MELQDCIIIGGGPAGLNAAVILGRSRRRVMVFDTEQYRNKSSQGMHNYLTRDGILPHDFLKHCHNELQKYGVLLLRCRIVNASKNDEGIFVARDHEGKLYYSRKLLVATGLTDTLPGIPGFREMYGKSVFHCPYCDAWEVRDKKLGVYAKNKEGWELALSLKTWSDDVTLYTDGRNKVRPDQEKELQLHGIPVVRTPFDHLKGDHGQLQSIIFRNGEERPCDALFFVNGYSQQCNVAEAFGCEINSKGVVVTNRLQQTNITGLYVAGDASKDMHFVVVAAGEGAKAGVIINKELQKEARERAAQQFTGKMTLRQHSFNQ